MSTIASSSSTVSTVIVVVLAVAAVVALIVVPVWRNTSRGRHRRRLLADAAIVRRLRDLGDILHLPDDAKTRAAMAATRKRLVDEFRDGAAR